MKDIEEVEKVQSRATKQVKSLRGLSHEQRLKSWIYQHWNIDVIVETWLKIIKFYTEFTAQMSRLSQMLIKADEYSHQQKHAV